MSPSCTEGDISAGVTPPSDDAHEPWANQELRHAAQWYEQQQAGLDGDFRGMMALSLNQLQRYLSAGNHATGVHSDLDAR